MCRSVRLASRALALANLAVPLSILCRDYPSQGRLMLSCGFPHNDRNISREAAPG